MARAAVGLRFPAWRRRLLYSGHCGDGALWRAGRGALAADSRSHASPPVRFSFLVFFLARNQAGRCAVRNWRSAMTGLHYRLRPRRAAFLQNVLQPSLCLSNTSNVPCEKRYGKSRTAGLWHLSAPFSVVPRSGIANAAATGGGFFSTLRWRRWPVVYSRTWRAGRRVAAGRVEEVSAAVRRKRLPPHGCIQDV